jgi:hypothetical protein
LQTGLQRKQKRKVSLIVSDRRIFKIGKGIRKDAALLRQMQPALPARNG